MLYTLNANLSKAINLNAGDLGKNGAPLAEVIKNVPVSQRTFQYKSETILTAAQLKEVISQTLGLPANITGVTVRSNGKTVEDSAVVTSYTVMYSAVLPKEDKPSAVSTTTQAPVETTTTTEAPAETTTTTEAPAETTTTTTAAA